MQIVFEPWDRILQAPCLQSSHRLVSKDNADAVSDSVAVAAAVVAADGFGDDAAVDDDDDEHFSVSR